MPPAGFVVESIWQAELNREDAPSQTKKFMLKSMSPHFNIQIKVPGKFQVYTVPLQTARRAQDGDTLLLNSSPHLCGTPYYGDGVLPEGNSSRKAPLLYARERGRLTLTTTAAGVQVETDVEAMETAEDKSEGVKDGEMERLISWLAEPVYPTLDLPEGTQYVWLVSEETETEGQGLCSKDVLMFEEVLDSDDEDNIFMDEEAKAAKAAKKAEKHKKKAEKAEPRKRKGRREIAAEPVEEEKKHCVRIYQAVWNEVQGCYSGVWWLQAGNESASINPFASPPVLKEEVGGQTFTLKLSSGFDPEAAKKEKKAKTEAQTSGYMCPVCNDVFAVCAQLTNHKRKSGHGSSQCQVCSAWIPSRCAMKKHKKRQGHEVFVGQAVANKLCRAAVQKAQRSKRKRDEVISEMIATQSKEEKQWYFAIITGLPIVEKTPISSSSLSSSLCISSSPSPSPSPSLPPSPTHSISSHSSLFAPTYASTSIPISPSATLSSSSSLIPISRFDKLMKLIKGNTLKRLGITPIEDSVEMPMGEAGSDGTPASSRGVMFLELSSSKELDLLVVGLATGLRLDKSHTLFCKLQPDLNDEYYASFNRWAAGRQGAGQGGVDWLPVFETPSEDTFFVDSGFRKNIPEKPAKTVTSWFADPFSADYARSMGVTHLLAPPEIDEEKKRLEEEEAELERARKAKATTATKKPKVNVVVKPKVSHFASVSSNLDPLLRFVKENLGDSKSRSPAVDKVLQMTEELFKQIDSSDVLLGVKAEEKHSGFVAQVWLARAQAMLALSAFANCLACADKGSNILDTYPDPQGTDLSVALVEISEEARRGLGVGLAAPKGVSARFLVEYTLAHCPATDNDEDGKISKTWLTQHVTDGFILPETRALGMSYVNCFLDPQFGDSNMFVSHAWGATWLSLVQACVVEQVSGAASKSLQKDKLVVGAFEKDENSAATTLYEKTSSIAIRKQCEAMLEALRTCPLPPVFFWVDVFCKNQHSISSEDTATELSSQIKGCGQMMLVLQPLDSPVSLSRVWCLFEVLTCINCKTDMSVALSFDGMRELDDVIMGTRKQLVSSKVDDPMLASLVEQRGELKENILVESAAAAVPADKVMIMDLVESSVGIPRMNDLVRRAVDGSVLAWQVSTIRHWARQRKSRKWEKRVENMEIMRKEYEAAEKLLSTRK